MSDAKPPTIRDNSEPPLESLLRLLDSDRDRAGEKYEGLRRKLIKFFEWNCCFPPEDLADQTFERLEQRIGEVQIRDVAGFAWGIAKNLRQEAQRNAAKTVLISDLPGGQDALSGTQDTEKEVHEKIEEERRFQCLRRCFQSMPVHERKVFLAYHNVEGEHLQYRQQLARRLGLTIGALRVRVNRSRDDLERCARKCFASWHIKRSRTTSGNSVGQGL